MNSNALKNNTFFITGATGFLGSRLLLRLLKAGGHAYCLRRQKSDLSRVRHLESRIAWVDLEGFDAEHFFYNTQVDCLVHCATDYGRKSVDPMSTIEANLALPLKLLHHAAQSGVRAFSSTDTVLSRDLSGYSLSKRQFTEWLGTYSRKIIAVNVALQHFYGPGDDPTKFTSYIVNALVRGEERIKLTPGEQERDFIYIDDVIEAFDVIIRDALLRPSRSDLIHYEVGSGETCSVRSFVEQCKHLAAPCDTQLDFGALPYRPHEAMQVSTNLTLLKSLGWRPQFSVAKGLMETIKACRQELKCAI